MSDLVRLGVILTDRGSKYAVSGATVASRADIDSVLNDLKSDEGLTAAITPGNNLLTTNRKVIFRLRQNKTK